MQLHTSMHNTNSTQNVIYKQTWLKHSDQISNTKNVAWHFTAVSKVVTKQCTMCITKLYFTHQFCGSWGSNNQRKVGSNEIHPGFNVVIYFLLAVCQINCLNTCKSQPIYNESTVKLLLYTSCDFYQCFKAFAIDKEALATEKESGPQKSALSPMVLLWDKWRKKPGGNWLTHVHLRNGN